MSSSFSGTLPSSLSSSFSIHPDQFAHKRRWWKEANFYQIYPASFKDSNGDGRGDLPGIMEKMPYLRSLGVEALWLSPIFDSPQIDMGYDISDYESIFPPYGIMADMKELIRACHDSNMKIILDLVVNHTSDQHAWFKESRSSKSSPKRDFYFWRPAQYDENGQRMPPCNWRSYRGGSAWTWDECTQEYYLHIYDTCQPDLNWENAECRQAIYNSAMRFWLDKGVDGFRIDTVSKYSKVLPFEDVPLGDSRSSVPSAEGLWCNGPRIHEYIHEMSDVLKEYTTFDGLPCVSVGELARCPDPENVLEYISAEREELDMVLQSDITRLGKGRVERYLSEPWKLSKLKAIVKKWQTFIDGTDAWTTVCAENHDNGRSVARLAACPKLLALWLAGQTGTLFLYQGQEIGMLNAPEDWDIGEEYKDPVAQSDWKEALRQADMTGDMVKLQKVKEGMQLNARDHSRLPFQWSNEPNAGFSTGTPWMRVHDDYANLNAKDQEAALDSALTFWKQVLLLRKEYKDVLVYGTFELLDEGGEEVFVYRKVCGEMKAVVVLNFTEVEQIVPCWEEVEGMKVLVSTAGEVGCRVVLGRHEGRMYVNY